MLPLTPRRRLLGGLALAACLQYFAAELAAAAAWTDPPYDWRANYISDLGVPECGPNLCSPAHAVMSTAFVVQGVLVACALAALWPLLGRGRPAVAAAAACYSAGIALVGLFPAADASAEPLRAHAHVIGAVLALAAGNLLALCAAAAARRRYPVYAAVSALLGAAGLAATALVPHASANVGLVERVAADTIVVWLVATGALLLRSPRSPLFPSRGTVHSRTVFGGETVRE